MFEPNLNFSHIEAPEHHIKFLSKLKILKYFEISKNIFQALVLHNKTIQTNSNLRFLHNCRKMLPTIIISTFGNAICKV